MKERKKWHPSCPRAPLTAQLARFVLFGTFSTIVSGTFDVFPSHILVPEPLITSPITSSPIITMLLFYLILTLNVLHQWPHLNDEFMPMLFLLRRKETTLLSNIYITNKAAHQLRPLFLASLGRGLIKLNRPDLN